MEVQRVERTKIIESLGGREHILEILLELKKADGGVISDESTALAADKTDINIRQLHELIGFYSMLYNGVPDAGTDTGGELFLEDYLAAGGMKALAIAKEAGADAVIKKLKDSGLRGRGGAAFPTGLKWEMVSQEKEPQKYIVCNADEGEAGAFKDKAVIEHMPLKMLEGMAIAAEVTGAKKGYIYLRGEYRMLLGDLRKAIALFEPYFPEGFSAEVILGAGAYICGEETALLSSIEGKRGEPRMKPPFPTAAGLYGKPTLINNAETFAVIPDILCGTGISKLVSISGAVNRPGVYAVDLEKYSVRDLVESDAFGGGIREGKKLGFVQLGGYSGSLIFPEQMNIAYGYDSMRALGTGIGSGAILVFDEDTSVVEHCRTVLDFFIDESCGKCSVCRNGLPYIRNLLEAFCERGADPEDLEKLELSAASVSELAFCGLGKGALNAVLDALKFRRKEFAACTGQKKRWSAEAVFGRCQG